MKWLTFPTHHLGSIMLNPIVLLLNNPCLNAESTSWPSKFHLSATDFLSFSWVRSWFFLSDAPTFVGSPASPAAVDLRSRRGQLREGHPAAAAGGVAPHRSRGAPGDVHGSWAEMGWWMGKGHQDWDDIWDVTIYWYIPHRAIVTIASYCKWDVTGMIGYNMKQLLQYGILWSNCCNMNQLVCTNKLW